jgi:hypothetical protein
VVLQQEPDQHSKQDQQDIHFGGTGSLRTEGDRLGYRVAASPTKSTNWPHVRLASRRRIANKVYKLAPRQTSYSGTP